MEWNFNLVLAIFSSISFFLFQKGFKLDMIYETQVLQIKLQYLYKGKTFNQETTKTLPTPQQDTELLRL